MTAGAATSRPTASSCSCLAAGCCSTPPARASLGYWASTRCSGTSLRSRSDVAVGYAASSGGHLALLDKATLTRIELASGKALPALKVDGLEGPMAVGDASLVLCADGELVRLRWKDGRETAGLPWRSGNGSAAGSATAKMHA